MGIPELPGSDLDLLRDVYMTPKQQAAFDRIKAELTRLRAQVPEGWVVVPREAAQVAATVASEWADMFASVPGLEKYEQYSYGPAVEQMREDMLAAAAPTPQKGVDGE